MRRAFLLLLIGGLTACSHDTANWPTNRPSEAATDRKNDLVVEYNPYAELLVCEADPAWPPKPDYDLEPLGNLAKRWFREDLTDEERDQLVAEAKQLSLAEVAPLVFESRRRQFPYVRGSGYPVPPDPERPWVNPGLFPSELLGQMAWAVWHHHTMPNDDPQKNRDLLALAKNEDLVLRDRLSCVREFWFDRWCEEAEVYFLERAADPEEDLELRACCVHSLLRRNEHENHVPIAINVILAHEQGKPQCRAFHDATSHLGGRISDMAEPNRELVIETGFTALSGLSVKDIDGGSGYHVARTLGKSLKIENEFTPDHDDPKYRGAHGLNDRFFSATVRSALRWYRLSRPPNPDDMNDIDRWYDYQGGDRTTSYTIEVFETRDRPGHEWSPNRESGGYKVLWKKTFVVSVLENEFRELQPTTSGLLGPNLMAELVSRDISNEARDVVVEQLSQGDGLFRGWTGVSGIRQKRGSS